MRTDFSHQVLAIADRIKPLLAGYESPIQSAVLAELTSIWLAGHVVPEQPEETRTLRVELLNHHIELVRQLAEVNAKEFGTGF